MKILIEVVATNMDTGHIAVSQHSMDVECSSPQNEIEMYKSLSKSEHFKPRKVGPILVDRSLLTIIPN